VNRPTSEGTFAMPRRLWPALAALLAAAAAASAFPPVPPAKKKAAAGPKALDGTWKVVSHTHQYTKGLRKLTIYSKVEIKGGKWVQVRAVGGDGPAYSIRFDAAKAPPTIDMEVADRKTKTGARRGVFLLDGDRLTVTYTLNAKARPAKVDAELVNGEYRWVLQREKP
jgi:uncharacterized protein (TIGR03067 family)